MRFQDAAALLSDPDFLLPALALGLLLLLLAWAFKTFRGAGFTAFEAFLVLLVAPLASSTNVGLFERGNLVLAVNVAGVLVPAFVAARALNTNRIGLLRATGATALVAAVAYRVSAFVPGQGVVVLAVVPMLAGALAGLALAWGDKRQAPLLAYVGGALGTLVGADLVRLPEILALDPVKPTVLSIGGAGTLDAIFLVGVGALALQLVIGRVVGPRERRAR